MPLGLLRFTPTTIIHVCIVELHKKIVSRASSKKYQFPEVQSNAICVIAENITNSLMIHILMNNIIAHETAVCHNPHNPSDLDSYITRQLGYLLLHTFL